MRWEGAVARDALAAPSLKAANIEDAFIGWAAQMRRHHRIDAVFFVSVKKFSSR
jgi:hypothetical protein